MKNPTRPTREQKQTISALGLIVDHFLVCCETDISITLYNKRTGKIITRHKKEGVHNAKKAR